jgi:hypothetical protein
MEVAWSSETLVTYITTRCHNLDDHNLTLHRHVDLKTHSNQSGKIKVVSVLLLTEHYAMKAYGGVEV